MLISRMSCAGWRWKEQDGSTQKMCCCKQGKALVTACVPLCGLRAIRKVTSHCSSQTQPCPKRVPGVRHPVNSAPPKVAGEPRGRKMYRIKAGGRLRVPRPTDTAPQSGSGTFGRGSFFTPWGHVGGQFFLCSYNHHDTAGSRQGYAQNLMRRKQRRSSAIKCTSVSNEKAVCNSSDFLLCL
jgi:hypothetical protein